MARTLEQILTDANSVLDLEASIPTGDELVTRSNYANQVIWDAASLGQLSEFKKEFISTATTATIPLPSDYRELQENPRLLDSDGNWQEYEVIEVQQKYDKASSDRYAYIMGDPSSGYNLVVNNAISGATISVIYQRFPSGLLTLADVCELSDPQAVVRGIEAYVLFARSDDRLQVAEQKANRQLQNLLGREMKGTTSSRATKMRFKNPLSKGV